MQAKYRLEIVQKSKYGIFSWKPNTNFLLEANTSFQTKIALDAKTNVLKTQYVNLWTRLQDVHMRRIMEPLAVNPNRIDSTSEEKVCWNCQQARETENIEICEPEQDSLRTTGAFSKYR